MTPPLVNPLGPSASRGAPSSGSPKVAQSSHLSALLDALQINCGNPSPAHGFYSVMSKHRRLSRQQQWMAQSQLHCAFPADNSRHGGGCSHTFTTFLVTSGAQTPRSYAAETKRGETGHNPTAGSSGCSWEPWEESLLASVVRVELYKPGP